MNLAARITVSLGNQVAQLVSAGDVSGARNLAGPRNTWTSDEFRAISAACKRWGVDPMSFMG